MVALSVSNLEVVGSGPPSGCHKISSRSATCGEMQNPEISHKFLCKYSGAVYAKIPNSQKVVILHSGPKLLGGVGGRCPCMHNS